MEKRHHNRDLKKELKLIDFLLSTFWSPKKSLMRPDFFECIKQFLLIKSSLLGFNPTLAASIQRLPNHGNHLPQVNPRCHGVS
jgi:hypothetical protein